MGKPRSDGAKFVKTEIAESESAGSKPAGTKTAVTKTVTTRTEKAKTEKAEPAKTTRNEKAKTVVRRHIFSGFKGQLKSTPKEAVAAAFLSAIGNFIHRKIK